MLTGMLGLRLVLLIGKSVPLPAPAAVMTALQHVQVINDADGEDGFQITFALGKGKVGEYGLLASGTLDPDRRVVIGVLLGVTLEPLIDGIIHHLQIEPSSEPGMSKLTVSGRDISVMLDLEEKNAEYPNRPDSQIVNEILASYAQYGIVPQATPTTDVPLELRRVPRQHETDLRFIRRMAQRNGYVFYTEPLALGTTAAYFGPAKRLGVPQPALSIGAGAAANVTALSFANDVLAPVEMRGSFVDPVTKSSMSIPALPSLRVPPLATQAVTARRTLLMRNTGSQDPGQAAVTALAATTGAPEAVSATGQLDTVRYGSVLRARRLVGVRGVGVQNDGVYYVRRVTHEIEPGKYTQDFTLSREGTGPVLPAVRP